MINISRPTDVQYMCREGKDAINKKNSYTWIVRSLITEEIKNLRELLLYEEIKFA